MKAKETVRLGTFRMLKTALTNKSIEKGRALEAAEELQVVAVARQAAARLDRAVHGGQPPRPGGEGAGGDRGSRDAAAAGGVRRRHRGAVEQAVIETGAAGPKDMGKVMKAVMAALSGKTADGKKVNEAVRDPAEPLIAGRPLSRSTRLHLSTTTVTQTNQMRGLLRLSLLKGLVSLSPSS